MIAKHELEAMQKAAEILGAVPAQTMTTQDPIYRAFSILTDAIESAVGDQSCVSASTEVA